MPVSALVLTSADPRGDLAGELARDPRFSVGAADGAHLPVVLETTSLEESEEVVEALLVREDVLFVDVVSVDFSDLEFPADPPLGAE